MPAMKAADGTLTDAKGMTLYTFDKDAGGKSACNGGCATNWPPLTAAADAKAVGRLDGRHPRRRQQAMGVQGQAALRWCEGREAGRQDGRRLQQRLARRALIRGLQRGVAECGGRIAAPGSRLARHRPAHRLLLRGRRGAHRDNAMPSRCRSLISSPRSRGCAATRGC